MPNTTALAKKTVVEVIKDSVSEFAKRLPRGTDPTRWVRQLATAIQKNPDLLECERGSLLLAAYEAAELGISLSPALQLGYLIPYKGKAQFQISWRGLVQKAYDSGCVKTFYAEVVYTHDKFERQFGPKRNLFHAPAGDDRGEAIGAYALVEFTNGNIDWEYCDKALIERHRNHSRQPDSLMWREFWEEGWKKTAIRILAKRLPLSNPRMDALAEVVERDTPAGEEPSGRLELEPDSVLMEATQKQALAENMHTSFPSQPIAPEKTPQIAPESQQGHDRKVFVEVGDKLTVVSGQTRHIADDLPKLGGKWDGDARVWHMPAMHTDELLSLCQAKQIGVEEICAKNSEASQPKMLWPHDKQ